VEAYKTVVGRVETWLLQNGTLRRPMSNKAVPQATFKKERNPGVRYIIYQRQQGTYSDGKGGLPLWKRV